jgi:predicted transglutaminase-like cysteine proteinase
LKTKVSLPPPPVSVSPPPPSSGNDIFEGELQREGTPASLVTLHDAPIEPRSFIEKYEGSPASTLFAAVLFGRMTADLQLPLANGSPDRAWLRQAALTPNSAGDSDETGRSAEPFDLPVITARPSDVSAKWTDLQGRIKADERTLSDCRRDKTHCTKAARRFLSIIELGQQQHGRARLGWVNRAVNLSVRPMSDWEQYGYADYWASPLQTLRSEAGDCEDYAIVKYVALHELGIRSRDLRLVIVQDSQQSAEHAVAAVRYEKHWLILDNRTMMMSEARQTRYYAPLFVMDKSGVRTFVTATAQAGQ